MIVNERKLGGGAVLDVSGAISQRTLVALAAAVRDQIREGCAVIVLNLEKVTAVDLAGLGGLLELHSLVRNHGGQLRLAGVAGSIRDLVVITRLLTVFENYDSVSEALAGGHLAASAAAARPVLSSHGLAAIQRFLRHV
jgi:anti-sigma B factor antagonist